MQHHTTQDLLDAIGKMSAADIKRVHIYIGKLIFKTPYADSKELLHEILYRHAIGRRHWPVGLPIRMYLCKCAESITSSWRQRKEVGNESLDEILEQINAFDPSRPRAPRRLPTVRSAEEEALIAEAARERDARLQNAYDELAGDPLGRLVLEGVVEGLTPREMGREYGAREGAIKAARQRVYNRFKSAREEGQ